MQTALKGQGIVLAYFKAGTYNVGLECVAGKNVVKKMLNIKVKDADEEVLSCTYCADVAGESCDLKSLEKMGNIWRKDENSCWVSYDGFQDSQADNSDNENGVIDEDFTDNGVSGGDDDDPSQNDDDPNQGDNPDQNGGQQPPVCHDYESSNLVLNHSFEDFSKFKVMEDPDKDIVNGRKTWNIYSSKEINHWTVKWTKKSREASAADSSLLVGVCGEETKKGMLELQTKDTLGLVVPDGDVYAELDTDCGGPSNSSKNRGSEFTNVKIIQRLQNLKPTVGHDVSFVFKRRQNNPSAVTNKVVFIFSGVKYAVDLNTYEADFIADSNLESKVYAFKGRPYTLTKLEGGWYRFASRISPANSTATLVIRDVGEPNSIGVLVDDIRIIANDSVCTCDGNVVDKNLELCPAKD